MAGLEFLRRFGAIWASYRQPKACGRCETLDTDVHVFRGASRVCLCGAVTIAEPQPNRTGWPFGPPGKRIYRGKWDTRSGRQNPSAGASSPKKAKRRKRKNDKR